MIQGLILIPILVSAWWLLFDCDVKGPASG